MFVTVPISLLDLWLGGVASLGSIWYRPDKFVGNQSFLVSRSQAIGSVPRVVMVDSGCDGLDECDSAAQWRLVVFGTYRPHRFVEHQSFLVSRSQVIGSVPSGNGGRRLWWIGTNRTG